MGKEGLLHTEVKEGFLRWLELNLDQEKEPGL